ncbi:hypothetical protein COZ84_02440 [Candidatus Kuenenbacteria bacterium CG_4_8_14_3_um_filter_39_15]|uniref:HEPN domain-containing protein n=1 Tax=Candidatus Kuenenbacteria bacterium CG_4_8_14_3_um_filter_39_15 TaxID=1974615 RepID=A0A2M7ILG0_9BACT|nr:MAG: hypothetical protein COZ84_02440 [Candidatus Kuenenbacteria bacterium CG_4_8_14_3_um_filter_39_15]
MIKNGNQWALVFDGKEFNSEDKMWNKYSEATKWSDFKIIIPALFLFFHGLELLSKCFLFLADNTYINTLDLNHNLEDLYNKVKENYKNNSELVNIIKKYSYLNQDTPSIIQDFIKINPKIKDIQDFYQSLRYPSTKQLQTAYNYGPMKYKEKEGLPFAQELKGDIGTLLIQSIKIYRAKQS